MDGWLDSNCFTTAIALVRVEAYATLDRIGRCRLQVLTYQRYTRGPGIETHGMQLQFSPPTASSKGRVTITYYVIIVEASMRKGWSVF